MSYNRLFSIVVIFFIQNNIHSQITSTSDSSMLQSITTGKFSLFYSVNKIESQFLRFLKNRKDFNLEMVEPFQEFNKTDIQVDGFPNKRLIVLGCGNLNTNFILYESGGNALYNVCIVFKKKGRNKYDFTLIRLDTDVVDFDHLRAALEMKKFSILI